MVIARRPEDEIISELLEKKFDVIVPEKAQQQEAEDEEQEDSDEPTADTMVARVKSQKGYDYLLNMSIRSLTMEKVRRLIWEWCSEFSTVGCLGSLIIHLQVPVGR